MSCEGHEDDADRVVEVDYFGRLNGGRTKPRNQRMHFNEVIDNIKAACRIKQDETGRLKIGYCGDGGKLEEWAIVDSPMESMGLYIRLMKYGHIQTDPNEEDYWAHGDPATMPRFQSALGPEDWLKFDKSVQHLLPGWSRGVKFKRGEEWYDNGWITSCFADDDGDGLYEVIEPFTDANKNGVYDPPDADLQFPGEAFSDFDGDGERDAEAEWFNPACAVQEELSNNDFIRASSFLAGAANKTGFITRDLVQYFNRIGKVMTGEGHTVSPPKTLPALVRICDVTGALDPGSEFQSEPDYSNCTDDNQADSTPLPNADLFPDVLERFVDFGAVEYDRMEWRDETIEGIFPLDASDGIWRIYAQPFGYVVPLTGWLAYVNGPDAMLPDYYDPTFEILGFVESAKDGVRSIEFVHNYAVPVDLWPEYHTVAAPQKSPVVPEKILAVHSSSSKR